MNKRGLKTSQHAERGQLAVLMHLRNGDTLGVRIAARDIQ